ncbi:MAG: hypothetical protein AB7G54_07725 [Methyloceanibacter sp.]
MRSSCASRARLGLFVLASAGLVTGLVTQGAARDPAAPYLGMTKDEIIACAGEPHSRFRSGANAETLTFRYSGAGPVPAEPSKDKDKSGDKDESKDKKPSIADIFGGKKGKKSDKDWTCSASLRFEDGKLTSVNFAHKDARSPYAWQAEKDPKKQEAMRNEELPTCTFSLPRCSR